MIPHSFIKQPEGKAVFQIIPDYSSSYLLFDLKYNGKFLLFPFHIDFNLNLTSHPFSASVYRPCYRLPGAYERLAIALPAKADRQVALQDLAGYGSPHALAQHIRHGLNGHDFRWHCKNGKYAYIYMCVWHKQTLSISLSKHRKQQQQQQRSS